MNKDTNLKIAFFEFGSIFIKHDQLIKDKQFDKFTEIYFVEMAEILRKLGNTELLETIELRKRKGFKLPSDLSKIENLEIRMLAVKGAFMEMFLND
jgi:hypothetical protein